MSEKRAQGAHIGTASILLIFAVLSLVSFATLALVNSKADYRLSTNFAQRQTAYYEACHRGNAFIAAVNSGYTGDVQDDIIKKSIPITDNQSLDIALISNKTENSANSASDYTVIQWQIVNHSENDYDYTLPVFK